MRGFARKRWLVSVAVLLLLSLVLAACSSGKQDEADAKSVKKETGANSGKGDTTAEKGTSGEEAAKREISILLSHNNSGFASKAPDEQKQKYYDELKKLSGYNVKYEYLGMDIDFRQQMALRFASGELADLVRTDGIDSQVHQGAVDQGVFHELGPLIDQYGQNLKKKIPDVAWNSPRVTKNGKIYGIPTLSGAPADRIMFYRQDFLDKVNMEVPKTLDEFTKFAEAVHNTDVNGDGDPHNTWALSLTDAMSWRDVLTGSFGIRPGAWHLHNGQLEPDIIQPEMKEAIAYYKMLYDKGYIEKNFITKKQGDSGKDIFSGTVAAWGAATYQYPAVSAFEYPNQPNAAITMAVPPKGPRGENYLQIVTDQIYFVWTIPADRKNPEEIIKFLDWAWSSPEADKFFAYGINGHNYTEENGQIKFDPLSERNTGPLNEKEFFQLSMNVRENGLNNPAVLKAMPSSDVILKGYKDSESTILNNDAMYMPKLKALDGRPELSPDFASGSLFYDEFVKLVVGKEDLDKGFDAFVKEWKQRGGDAAIKEATDWYNSKKK
ncbi:extracellular solute-binding protein [Paenibacillus spongiae]|uniref:Extracellular solute-binding protein n=1 Tax=Paenibacillus spongiae TaxID=2909671 RepID=A0ABY5S989_9BACL|nr:extracellular solute-binding protein [Paenibacillus spongiae]UVI29397.1 extracellular solute-binding protein [Paenibacillus spongiae]